MKLTMNREVFITCAVTGSGNNQDRSPDVPRNPEQIADSAAERVHHAVDRRPEICTLDRGTMHFAVADCVNVNTPGMLRDMAALATNAPLVERAGAIIKAMGAGVIGPDEVRARLKLAKRAPL